MKIGYFSRERAEVKQSFLLAGFVACLFAVAPVSDAAPAGYFVWKSKTSDAQLCAQTSPGEFWEKTTGPYKDPQCEKLTSAKAPPPPLIILVPVVKTR